MALNNLMRRTMPPSRQAFGDGIERLEAALRTPLQHVESKKRPPPAPNALPYAGRVYSQNGEDGILAAIFGQIGVFERTFIELGVEEGLECNSRLLLESGWTGVWIEGDPQFAERARQTFSAYVATGALKIVDAQVTCGNINKLLDTAGVPAQVDFLSVDIDLNTTHVWRAINRRARVSCIEYNSSLPPSLDIEVVYDGDALWDGTNYYGGSLKTIEAIGQAKHLKLIGCEARGVNAFLVSDADVTGRFPGPFDALTHYVPFAAPDGELGHRPSAVARRWRVNEQR